MKLTQRIGALTFGIAAAALAGTSVHAQVSDARLHDLMQQAVAQLATPAPQQSGTTQTPVPGPTVSLTLDDAVKFALDRNLDLAVQRLNPQLQDIAIATALAAYNPTVTSAVNNNHTVGVPTSQTQLGAGGKGATQDQAIYNAGLTQSFRWFGTSLTGTFNNNRLVTDSLNSLFSPGYQSTWSALLNQPLLRGFKIDAGRRTLQVAKINRDISDDQLKASITNTVANVRNAYWDYVFGVQAVDVASQSLDLATKLVQDNQTRVEIGTMAPIDVVQAQAEQATRRQTLVAAESNRRTSELALKRLIVSGTEDPNWSATLDPVDRPEFAPVPVDLEGAIRRALSQRTDMEIAKKNIEANSVTVSYLHNQSLPQVDFQLNYGLAGIGGTQLLHGAGGVNSPVTGTIPGGLSDAFHSLLASNFPRWTYGVNVSYPLGTSTQDAAIARARVQLNQVQAQSKQIELQVATEVTNAAIQLRNNAEAVQAAQAASSLSQKRLEAEQSKFEVGMSTNYFVVQAQRDLNDARNSELRAVLNYRKAQVEFDRLQQTTLQSANITVIAAGGAAAVTGP